MLLIVIGVFSLFFFTNNSSQTANAQTSSACHTLDNTQAVADGFAASYNPFTPQQELLLQAQCNPSDTTVTLGNGNLGLPTNWDGRMWVWNQGYQLLNNTWQPVTYTCSGEEYAVTGGSWCRAEATGTLDSLSTHYLGYTCQWHAASGSYKCGCLDSSCTSSFWHLQEVLPGATSTLTDGLIGHWRFDGDTQDSSGQGNHGTAQGGPTFSTGKLGQGLSFDGTDDYIQTTSDELKTTSSLTIAAWIRADNASMRHIIWQGAAAGNGGGAEEELALNVGNTVNGASNQLQFFVEGVNDDINITTSFSDTTNWHHVAAVVTGLDTTPQAELFLDGVSIGTDIADSISRSLWDTNLRIGRPGAATRLFDGAIDDVRVYTRALSQADITELYAWSGAPDTEAPIAPTNPSATAVSQSQINLSWTASADNVGVTNYRIRRCQGSSCTPTTVLTTISPATGFQDTGLSSNTTYRYTISALDGAGNESGQSTIIEATTLAPDTDPPTIPTNLSATPQSSSQINLSWTASTDNVGVTGYRVERCQGSSCSNFAQIAIPSGTTFSNTGLTANTTYRYRVRAEDATGNFSGYSSTTNATTHVSPPPDDDADFQARCSANGVVTCIGFDNTTTDIVQNVNLWPDGKGVFRGGLDTTIKTSGIGSLRFELPPNANQNISGQWSPLLPPYNGLGFSFGQNSTFYVQFRQRFSPEMLSNTSQWNSRWKQMIVYRGFSACGAMELTTVHYNWSSYPQNFPIMYTDCGARSLNTNLDGQTYNHFNPPFLMQQGDFNCEYGNANANDCFYYPTNKWVTFYYKFAIGSWGQANSVIEAWYSVDGQPYKKWINVQNYTLNYNSSPSDTFNNISLLPYMTGLSPVNTPTAYTWYDELIVSSQPIAVPGEGE